MHAYQLVTQCLNRYLDKLKQSYVRLLEVDNIQKSRVVSAVLIFFHGFFWLSIALNRDFKLFNLEHIPAILSCLQLFMLCAVLLFLLSYRIQATAKTELYFPILTVGFYSGSLMMVGYIAGMMTLLTGVFTMGSILAGLLLFERRIMFYASLPCILVLYITSILNVLALLPYAPLYLPQSILVAETQNYVILVNLFATTFIAIILVILFNSFLDRWIDRERKQRYLMTVDPLTQILNRRGISNRFAEIQQDLASSKHIVCVALIDIDYFKKINDQYGHDAGDQVLIDIAQILRLNTRQPDHVGRFGGEEFLIIFEDTSTEVAQQILERCRLAIEQHRVNYQDCSIQLTASFGLSCSSQIGMDQHSLILVADQALYQAKHAGRNQICIA